MPADSAIRRYPSSPRTDPVGVRHDPEDHFTFRRPPPCFRLAPLKSLARLLASVALGIGVSLLMVAHEYDQAGHLKSGFENGTANWIGASLGAMIGLMIGLAWIGNAALQEKHHRARREKNAQSHSICRLETAGD